MGLRPPGVAPRASEHGTKGRGLHAHARGVAVSSDVHAECELALVEDIEQRPEGRQGPRVVQELGWGRQVGRIEGLDDTDGLADDDVALLIRLRPVSGGLARSPRLGLREDIDSLRLGNLGEFDLEGRVDAEAVATDDGDLFNTL